MWPFEVQRERRRAGLFSGLPMLLLGVAGMYYLDPDRGRRRRAMLRDKLLSQFHCAEDRFRRSATLARDRAIGLVAEARAGFTEDHADDPTIAERVRSAIGRAVSHPGAINVRSDLGVVTLTGEVLADEVEGLISMVEHVRGVREVRDRLDIYETPGDVPSLQGQPRNGARRQGAIEHRDPIVRLLTAGGGAVLAIWGLIRRDLVGILGGAAGVGMLRKSLSNGNGAARGKVDWRQIQKTINVHAPIEEVFRFFASYENFPSFMRNVREVRAHNGTGRSHWVVSGPMGASVTWDAELTHYAPNELIAWESLPGAMVGNAGVMRFSEERLPEGPVTRLDIKLSYDPPAGALGHVVARLFGADPKSEMDADLARVKTMLETGNPPHDASRPVAASSAM